MRILIANSNVPKTRHFNIGIAKVLALGNNDVTLWDKSYKPVFDAFDEKNPEILFIDSEQINDQIVRCIKENGASLQVVVKANPNAKGAEIRRVEEIEPELVYTTNLEKIVEESHKNWLMNVESVLPATNVVDYINGGKVEEFASQVCCISEFTDENVEFKLKWLHYLCDSRNSFRVKVFSNRRLDIIQNLGYLHVSHHKHMLRSAAISLNLTDPDEYDYPYSVCHEIFDLMANKGFALSNISPALEEVFDNDEVMFFDSEKTMLHQIEHYLKYPEERVPFIQRGYENVINNHTYFHRADQIFNLLGVDLPSKPLDTLERITNDKSGTL